ncbi:DRTGG domain-containing protein [Thermohalobacter berrensis]|uniref:Serine kinase n=1 Tax=Thermohalobacter berrensis TaxID=99594 RepID=A0A419T6F5_9FIRM|nr:DRTGG domain-containing protein [Thermohalobacter berrensis]RKD33187.1 serine kinase [Thermohalobacter berrensis]
MKLTKIIDELNATVVVEPKDETEVEGVYIGDLLSLVMAKAQENDIWITIQTHINIVAVATLVNLSAIVIAEGMDVDEDTIKKAKEENIPILKSELSAYEIACKLCRLGV